MDELNDRRQFLAMARAGASKWLPAITTNAGPQTLAAGLDDVMRYLVDQHHFRGQAAADYLVHSGHVFGNDGREYCPGLNGLVGKFHVK